MLPCRCTSDLAYPTGAGIRMDSLHLPLETLDAGARQERRLRPLDISSLDSSPLSLVRCRLNNFLTRLESNSNARPLAHGFDYCHLLAH